MGHTYIIRIYIYLYSFVYLVASYIDEAQISLIGLNANFKGTL